MYPVLHFVVFFSKISKNFKSNHTNAGIIYISSDRNFHLLDLWFHVSYYLFNLCFQNNSSWFRKFYTNYKILSFVIIHAQGFTNEKVNFSGKKFKGKHEWEFHCRKRICCMRKTSDTCNRFVFLYNYKKERKEISDNRF